MQLASCLWQQCAAPLLGESTRNYAPDGLISGRYIYKRRMHTKEWMKCHSLVACYFFSIFFSFALIVCKCVLSFHFKHRVCFLYKKLMQSQGKKARYCDATYLSAPFYHSIWISWNPTDSVVITCTVFSSVLLNMQFQYDTLKLRLKGTALCRTFTSFHILFSSLNYELLSVLFYGIFGMYRILFVVVFHIVMCAFALLIANCVCAGSGQNR